MSSSIQEVAQRATQIPTVYLYAGLILTAAAYLLYRYLLPKPYPGIPYHALSAQRVLGDIPAILSHEAQTGGNIITYLTGSIQTLNSPLIQVFLAPWGKPTLVLSDFREAHNLLVHRGKEFDRSPATQDLLRGLVPNHHIHLPTNAKWKAQRRLTQDLMTTSYLHNVAGPPIYESLTNLVEMWRVKSQLARGRPWSALGDMKLMALDAITTFAFGPARGHSAIALNTEVLEEMMRAGKDEGDGNGEAKSKLDEPVDFPPAKLPEVLQAIDTLNGTLTDLYGAPLPAVQWAITNRKPRVARARKVKAAYIEKQIREAVKRQEESSEREQPAVVAAAVDKMVQMEKQLAEKEERDPQFFSGVMFDELFGMIFAGSETTATTIAWSLKRLTDHPRVQTRLRHALHAAHPAALSSSRHPTFPEILTANIPYLDATMEEMFRWAGTSPFVDRAATGESGALLLGHHVPHGTPVLCLHKGPSMMSPAFDVQEGKRWKGKSERGAREWDVNGMDEFMPERWLVHGKEGEEVFDATAGPSLAFGLGPRGCFGKKLVYMEVRVLLTLLLWTFELEKCPSELSGYGAILKTTSEPTQFYLRLRERNKEGTAVS